MTLRLRPARLLPAATLALAASACLAADANPAWNGTWKMNPDKSKLTGSVDHISLAPDGKWTVTTAGVSFSFSCDGKEYPILLGRTMVCHKISDTEVDTVIKANGEEIAHVKRTLSDNGRTETAVSTGTAPDGTPFTNTETYKKVSGEPGWPGTWRNTRVEESRTGVAVIETSGNAIKFTYPMQKTTLTARLDGTPAREEGPRAEPIDISLTSAGPRVLHETDVLNGKPLEHDTLTLSPDGKTLTIEALRTGDPEKQVYVFEKQ